MTEVDLVAQVMTKWKDVWYPSWKFFFAEAIVVDSNNIVHRLRHYKQKCNKQ